MPITFPLQMNEQIYCFEPTSKIISDHHYSSLVPRSDCFMGWWHIYFVELYGYSQLHGPNGDILCVQCVVVL